MVSNTFATLGAAAGRIRDMFYSIEKVGTPTAYNTYLNRCQLATDKAFHAGILAEELPPNMNAASVHGGGYAVTFDHDTGLMNIARPAEAGTVNTC